MQVEGGQTSTGSVVAWYRRLVGDQGYEALDAEAAGVPPGCEGVVCLDHFQGNRTPHTDALSRGAITGLTLKHGRGHVFRALLEAVCYGTEHIFEAMRAAGYAPASVTVAGGATRSPLWLQIHADVSNMPFVLTKVRVAGRMGMWLGRARGKHFERHTQRRHTVGAATCLSVPCCTGRRRAGAGLCHPGGRGGGALP